jgi:DNA-directed RNA polymerase specialized sigma24 family protein
MASLDIANLLQQLPERQRLQIQYVKIEGGSVADAAKRTGITESAVKIRSRAFARSSEVLPRPRQLSRACPCTAARRGRQQSTEHIDCGRQ